MSAPKTGKYRPFMRWIQINTRRTGAILCEPHVVKQNDCDTPEEFYHNEMLYRSSLYHRAKVKGIRFKPELSTKLD